MTRPADDLVLGGGGVLSYDGGAMSGGGSGGIDDGARSRGLYGEHLPVADGGRPARGTARPDGRGRQQERQGDARRADVRAVGRLAGERLERRSGVHAPAA